MKIFIKKIFIIIIIAVLFNLSWVPLSFGEVCGKPPDLKPVSDPTSEPYNSIYFLCRIKNDSRVHCAKACTGYVINLRGDSDPKISNMHGRVLITAGHCLSDDWETIYPRKKRIYPIKTHTPELAKKQTARWELKKGHKPIKDYGIVILDKAVPGEGFNVATNTVKPGQDLSLAGFINDPSCPDTMHTSAGKALNTPGGEDLLYYTNPTTPGISGSPVWFTNNSQAVALHIGYSEPCKRYTGKDCLIGTDLSTSLMKTIKNWIKNGD